LIRLPTGRGRPGSIDVKRQGQVETTRPQDALWFHEKVIASSLSRL
jgi:hypothetical protein